MRRFLVAVLILSAAVTCFASSAFGAAAAGTLIKPWALNIPYGANITTEVNLTENDLLPTLKSMIPMIGDLAKMGAAQGLSAVPGMGGSMGAGVGEMGAQMMAGMDNLDTTQLAAALDGVKAVRLLVGTYPRHSTPKDFQMEFEKGLVKMGTFSKVMGNIQDTAVGIYAQSNNGGYVGYTYDPKKGTIMAARLVGSLDIQKIMNWVMEMAKQSAEKPAPAPTPEPEPAAPPAEPAPTQ